MPPVGQPGALVPGQGPSSHFGDARRRPRPARAYRQRGLLSPGLCPSVLVTGAAVTQGATVGPQGKGRNSALGIRNSSWRGLGLERLDQGELGRGPGHAGQDQDQGTQRGSWPWAQPPSGRGQRAHSGGSARPPGASPPSSRQSDSGLILCFPPAHPNPCRQRDLASSRGEESPPCPEYRTFYSGTPCPVSLRPEQARLFRRGNGTRWEPISAIRAYRSDAGCPAHHRARSAGARATCPVGAVRRGLEPLREALTRGAGTQGKQPVLGRVRRERRLLFPPGPLDWKLLAREPARVFPGSAPISTPLKKRAGPGGRGGVGNGSGIKQARDGHGSNLPASPGGHFLRRAW